MIDNVNLRSFYKNKKVFVTGHTGFIGSWLTKWLTMESADVCGYALEPQINPSMFKVLYLEKLVTNIRGDIRNVNLLRKTLSVFRPEIVLNLATQPIVL